MNRFSPGTRAMLARQHPFSDTQAAIVLLLLIVDALATSACLYQLLSLLQS